MESSNVHHDNALTSVQVITIGDHAVETVQELFHGAVVAGRDTELASKRIGRIDAVLVDAGDQVRTGDVLVRLEKDELDAAVLLAESELRRQRAVLAEYVAGPRAQELGTAQSRVDELEANLALRTTTVRRHEAGNRANAIASSELDQARFGLQSAEAQLQAARLNLDKLREGTRDERIEAQRAQVAACQAQLNQHRARLDNATIRAPYAGAIQSRYADEGAIVSPGQKILHLVEVDDQEIHVGIPPRTALWLQRRSEECLATAIIAGEHFKLTLKRMSPALDSTTGTRNAVFSAFPNRTDSLVPGESAEVYLQTEADQTGWWIPTGGLTSGSHGTWSIMRAAPTETKNAYRIELRPVELLRTVGELSQVQGQLSVGDFVVASGIHRVVPGQLVRIDRGASFYPNNR